MTPIQLLVRLTDRIRAVVQDYAMEESDGDHKLRAPRVHMQELPEKLYEDTVDEADYPFVLVVLGGGSLARKEGTCSVAVMAAGYEDSILRQGWQIPADILWRILADLAADPVMGPYKLQFPVDWTLPKEQPSPQWFGVANLLWELPAADLRVDLETMDLYPSIPPIGKV